MQRGGVTAGNGTDDVSFLSEVTSCKDVREVACEVRSQRV